jgi:hypothetical protein
MITPEQTIDTYYRLRQQYRRPTPLRTSKERRADDLREAIRFLHWCRDQRIDNVAGYMAERFKMLSGGSRRRTVPRIAQLAHDGLAERWSAWIEGAQIADAAYVKRMARDDQTALLVRSLAAEPSVLKESFKARHYAQPEACVLELTWSGGYDPRSSWCARCECAVRCAAELNAKHGFDVVALRSGRVHQLPDKIASALLR